MSCVILESKLQKGEHVCDLERKESTKVVELDPAAVDRDEDVYCSLGVSSDVRATTLTSGTNGESEVQSFLNRLQPARPWDLTRRHAVHHNIGIQRSLYGLLTQSR